jgi:lactoylglutathione lyase
MTQVLTYRFQHFHIYCSDLDASERWFVEVLGARLRRRLDLGGRPFVVVEIGGAPIVLGQASPGQQLAGSDLRPPHVGLAVDDIDAVVAELRRRGVRFRDEPREPFELAPGTQGAHALGPDDIYVEFMEGGEHLVRA